MAYLAFDIGGTNTKYAIISEDGKILRKKNVKTPASYEELLQFIVQVFRRETAGFPFLGLSCPGIYNPDINQITGSSALSYLIEKDIVGDLQRSLPGVVVLIENDGNCALLGEMWKGHAQHLKNAAIIVVGSAIGGGAVVNGRLLRGAFLNGGEFGYMLVDNDVEKQSFHSLGGKGGVNGLVSLAQSRGCTVHNGIELFERLEKDEELASLMQRQLLYTAIGIINIQYVLDPGLILIGGAISRNETYIAMLHSALEKIIRQRPLYKIKPRIMAAKNSNDANLFGIVYKYIRIGHLEKQ